MPTWTRRALLRRLLAATALLATPAWARSRSPEARLEPPRGRPELDDAHRPSIEVAAFGVRANAPAFATLNGNGRQSPLFAATDALGLPESIGLQLAEIFAEEVDFHLDLVFGYRCVLVFEMRLDNGLPTPGRILAAEFDNDERRLEAFLYDDGTTVGYFDIEGVDINKTLRMVDPAREPWAVPLKGDDVARVFRKSPLEFSRITSLPATLRYHPILKEWRAHRGTDYGAPIGTRVYATADGVVNFVGVRGSYGNLVELRHFDRYTTRYGHLDRFAPGLAAGQTVRKNQLIGFVGMTGLATGPHLHYELFADEAGATPPADLLLAVRRLPPGQRAAFQRGIGELRRKLAFARRFNMVWVGGESVR